jgi:hypothetical protein
MKGQDRDFYRMKFWEIDGFFIRTDENDVEVRVNFSKQVHI